MPARKQRLSQQELTYATNVAKTGDPTYAAKVAGYSQPYVAVHRLKERSIVNAEVKRQQEARLFNDLLPAAVGLLERVLADETETTRNRIQAAKIVLDRTLGAPGAAESKDIHEMTAGELEDYRRKLEAQLREFAQEAIDVTPAQDPDVFG